jgi:putative phosphoribosyl transferase
MALFLNRAEAGRQLAAVLVRYPFDGEAIVLALPRGGLPVAFEVAQRLRAPLDIYMVRKIGVPGHPELAMGAVASDASYVADEALIEKAGVTPVQFRDVLTRELAELRRREEAYRDGRDYPLEGKTVLLVDDGLATGATMYAAARAVRTRKPARIVVAVPVASRSACELLETVADAVVCPYMPEPFYAVAFYYDDFAQVSDEDVRRILSQAERRHHTWQVA